MNMKEILPKPSIVVFINEIRNIEHFVAVLHLTVTVAFLIVGIVLPLK